MLPAAEGWDQLLYTAAGTMTISTPSGSWTVPPRRALWLADGERSTVRNRYRVAVRSLYFARGVLEAPATRAVEVAGFVRELLLHAVAGLPARHGRPAADAAARRAARAARGAAAAAVAERARRGACGGAHPRRSRGSMAEVARAVGMSRRTLERTFVAETGVTLGAWRRRSRIHGSLDQLAAGVPVTETALAAGYSTPSAFVAAFKGELGQTPRRYLRP